MLGSWIGVATLALELWQTLGQVKKKMGQEQVKTTKTSNTLREWKRSIFRTLRWTPIFEIGGPKMSQIFGT
jgi:hypothetical protein